jgi:hypothetical protein
MTTSASQHSPCICGEPGCPGAAADQEHCPFAPGHAEGTRATRPLAALVEAVKELLDGLYETGEVYDGQTLSPTYGHLSPGARRVNAALALARQHLERLGRLPVLAVYLRPQRVEQHAAACACGECDGEGRAHLVAVYDLDPWQVTRETDLTPASLDAFARGGAQPCAVIRGPGACEALLKALRVCRTLGWAVPQLGEELERPLPAAGGEAGVPRLVGGQGIGTLASSLEIGLHNHAVFYGLGRAGYVRVGLTAPTYYVVTKAAEVGEDPDEVGVNPPADLYAEASLVFLAKLGLYRIAAAPYRYCLEAEAQARCLLLAGGGSV